MVEACCVPTAVHSEDESFDGLTFHGVSLALEMYVKAMN